MKKRRFVCVIALLLTGLALLLIPPLLTRKTEERLPGKDAASRQLLRIWTVSMPGGSDGWLRAQLRQFERAHPGVMTYVRQVTAADCLAPDAVLPDVILYMPGSFMAPDALFTPLTGVLSADEPLLRCGRYQGAQYGLPLCAAGYVLCVDAAYMPSAEATPAPTTLLGRAAPTASADAAPPPVYPKAALSAAESPLGCPRGTALMLLSLMLPEPQRPAATDDLLSDTPDDAYRRFLTRQYASAVLTTGQYAALCEQINLGRAFPVSVFCPDTMLTDQLLLGSVVAGADENAAPLLSFLTSRDAQKTLSRSALFSVDSTHRLYASGLSADVENAFRRSVVCPNAYHPPEAVFAAAWQVWQGSRTLDDALTPLL